MDVFTELAKYPVFTIDDVKKHTDNEKTAYSQLNRLMKKDRVKKVRKNIYSAFGNSLKNSIYWNRIFFGSLTLESPKMIGFSKSFTIS